MPDAHAPMRNFLRFLSGEIPDILLRMVAVSSSGFSNIGWLLLISVSHFSYVGIYLIHFITYVLSGKVQGTFYLFGR